MSFLQQAKIKELSDQLTQDLSILGRLYKSKKKEYMSLSVEHSMVDQYLKEKWEVEKVLKTKTRIRKLKSHNRKFEDLVWCQMYDLGYRHLNYDESFILPFGKNEEDKKQISVVAIDDDTVILIDCKSSNRPKKAPSYKGEFELLSLKLDGFKKTFEQLLQRQVKLKFVFATNNLRIDPDTIEIKKLKETNSFYYNNNTFKYLTELIKKYKAASRYQFLGLLFKNQIINSSKVEIPALEGTMGNKRYYMFSIEPSLLLKMGFVLHRTRANEEEMPTYQRLLVPSRLNGISKFINDGGYFPNSIIINFAEKKHKLEFSASPRTTDSVSRYGLLKIPNAYAVAYIIDGQHRLYGYANSEYKDSNTVPVVAFSNLTPKEQLSIFMDINQNQKAVSPSLRLTLEEDLYWDSERADSRLKALRSSIIRELSENQNNVLYGKISIGEDKAILTFPPFYNALTHSGLLPTAKGNKYDENSYKTCLYDITNHNHEREMISAKKKVIQLLNYCYEFVESEYPSIYDREKYFILSNRGTYAFIVLIGSLNTYLTEQNRVDINTPAENRFQTIKKYLSALLDYLKSISKEEEEKQLKVLGAGAQTEWLRFFQTVVSDKCPEYNPNELIDWRERQNDELQQEGRGYGVAIEKKMKQLILEKLKTLYQKNWELEINTIKTACQARANAENEKNYKEKLNKKEVDWTEMFTINEYKKIIEDHWLKRPSDENETKEFVTFETDFSFNIGLGKNKKDVLKWISYFNSYRNLWAHEGTKEKRLNREEVGFLEKVYNHFY